MYFEGENVKVAERFNLLLTKNPYDVVLTYITLQSTDQVSNPHHSVPDDTDNSCSTTG